jgi:hypothetical protein
MGCWICVYVCVCSQLLAQHRQRPKLPCAFPAPCCGSRDPPHRCAFPARRSQALGKFPTAGEHGSHGDCMLRFFRPLKVDLPLFPWSDEHVCHSNMDVCVDWVPDSDCCCFSWAAGFVYVCMFDTELESPAFGRASVGDVDAMANIQ